MKTIEAFKESQNRALNLLKKLESFLDKGSKLGVEIDKNIKEKLQKAINDTSSSKLKVALIGGFSEGKTSIAAAWLERLDKTSMKISHEESSNEVVKYNIDNEIELYDTPGLFGFKMENEGEKRKYKDITRQYISEANLVLYVMNPSNPIKESHKEELEWLFRDLNLLPRTIFVISKFDEIADLEDSEDYNENLEIKKEMIVKRLDDLIKLDSREKEKLSIVAVAANPFDKGIEHWINNNDEFKKFSHIETLQNATKAKIEESGGFEQIIIDTKKSIIQDVFHKQLPIIAKESNEIANLVSKFEESLRVTKKDLDKLETKISNAKISLREFAVSYFSDLITQVRGCGMESINSFFDREIGEGGINVDIKIQNQFEREIGSIKHDIAKTINRFNAESDSFNKAMGAYGKQGINWLRTSGAINATTIKAGRDIIVAAGKTIGLDLGLKFKPWGAIKFARGANAALAVISLGWELWDSYNKYKKEQDFENVKNDMISKFEEQKQEIIDIVNSDDFEEIYFKDYIDYKQIYIQSEENVNNAKLKQEEFRKWEEESSIIEAEFEEID